MGSGEQKLALFADVLVPLLNPRESLPELVSLEREQILFWL